MNWKLYLKDKYMVLIGGMIFVAVLYLLGCAFRVPLVYMHALVFLACLITVVSLCLEYWKRKSFYKDFLEKLEGLDQKYLITEMIREPDFMDARIWYDALYEIDRSMKERINDLEFSQRDFREYIELWIHEVKVPLAALSCMNYNESWNIAAQKQQLDRLGFYVEQILFLSRADNPQKDYMIKKVSLEKLVNRVIRNHKELLIGNRIRIEKKELTVSVMTDAKWMEFIVGQLVNNSVKYSVLPIERQAEEEVFTQSSMRGTIRFEEAEYTDYIELVVTDYGIGICEHDIPRVFDKTFTGENGRKVSGSTGMGLYICRKLCDKMGHKIWLESKAGEYTRVHIEFGKEDYYRVVV